jgi:hypothetical protein
MSDYLSEIEEFNAAVDRAAHLSYMVRDSDLQSAAITELTRLAEKVAGWKRSAISNLDENHANIFLGCECVIETLCAELTMWLLLKDGKADDAWTRLIAAQSAARDAIRAHRGFSHLEVRAARLVNIERVVFPDQVFLSMGLIVRCQECSICGSEYEECDHIVGQPYLGEFCRCILRDVRPDHVAIVEEPANKQCRITHFNAEGGRRNRMTWRVEPDPILDPANQDVGLVTKGILISTTDVGGVATMK